MEFTNRLTEIIEDWKSFARNDGLKASARVIASDMVKLPYRHLHFVTLAHSLLDPIPDPPLRSNLTIRAFEKTDLDLVQRINRSSEARLCAKRLEQGHKGFIAFYDGQPAGYTWGSTDPETRIERVHPPLMPGDFLCTDSYTAPAFRGKGIQTALTLARFKLFRELGYCRAVCYIEIHNGPSLAVWQKKLNSQAIGKIDFMRIGPWYRIRYS